MLKAIAIIMLACLLIAPCSAGAGYDLQGMTTEELTLLQRDLTTELNGRYLKGSEIALGIYLVGRDLEPGDYELTLVQFKPRSKYQTFVNLALFNSSADYMEHKTNHAYYMAQLHINIEKAEVNIPLLLTLQNGQILLLGNSEDDDSICYLKKLN